ncbi:MAG: hypothetical protein KAT68_19525 [Bacteroidales bacterium]|nr:hypothetical protein [Bacteroidales bacterium]
MKNYHKLQIENINQTFEIAILKNELKKYKEAHQDCIKQLEQSITWSIEDIREQAEEKGIEITDEKAQEVLDILIKKHDAGRGITWNTIDQYLDLYK